MTFAWRDRAPNGKPWGKRHRISCSFFGGPLDPSSGRTGYHGEDLEVHWDTWAELSYHPMDFAALGHILGKPGGLPHGTCIRLTTLSRFPWRRKKLVLYKRDVGEGRPGSTPPRAVDVWYRSAREIGLEKAGLLNVNVEVAE